MTGLIVAVIVVCLVFAGWGVMRLEERYDPRPDTAPIPIIVPGRDTPAPARTHPPWAAAEAVTQFPAGGSKPLGVPYRAGVEAGAYQVERGPQSLEHETAEPGVMGTLEEGKTHGPGPGSLPEGDAPPRPPQEAPGPGALPPEVAAAFEPLRATIAELARQTDEEQFPDLMPAWEDNTGEFTRFVEDGTR